MLKAVRSINQSVVIDTISPGGVILTRNFLVKPCQTIRPCNNNDKPLNVIYQANFPAKLDGTGLKLIISPLSLSH